MKYCQKCGQQLRDEAVVCPGCGCAVNDSVGKNNTKQTESTGLATAALVCAFLCPLAGLICGIVGTAKYQDSTLKNRCIVSIVISIVVWIVAAILIL